MGEANLTVMYRALMRLMGMMFIECARLLMQVHDDHLRSLETVEVEVKGDGDEDDESLYMQTQLTAGRRPTWTSLLQQLIHMADSDYGRYQGLFAGLHRRIRNSLYLSSARGAQLQATLVATGGSDIHHPAEICDTEDNDQALIEQWWEGLKQHMDLGGTDSEGQQGQEVAAPASTSLADPRHSAEEVEQWERERQTIATESGQAELRAREAEEAEQEKLDEQLYEVHAASRFRDWEAWLVLHTPNTRKRRRLQVALQTGAPAGADTDTALATAAMEIPSGSTDYHIVMHMTQVEEPVQADNTGNRDRAPEGSSRSSLDINDGVFDRAFSAWKQGKLGSDLVQSIFGEDWLFLFEITRDGIEGDTMPPPPLLHRPAHGPDLPRLRELAGECGGAETGEEGNLVGRGPAPTQVDSGEGALMQEGGQWPQDLGNGDLVLDLDGSQPEHSGGHEQREKAGSAEGKSG